MTPELHQKAKQLFLAVCDLGETARHQYLDDHCRDDPRVRSEVESLLKHHVNATLIDKPAVRDLQGMNEHSAGMANRWPPGTVVAQRYRILNRLGKGGMGEVYRAEDTVLSRQVALKFITAGHGTDPLWLNSFYAEARTASTITHRHVCRIYDVGEADGEAFISMEYIDGEDLGASLRRVGRLTADKAVEITRQLCLGLAAVHERGILHRDLKPANVILDGRGEVRLTDFGIAVSLDTIVDRMDRSGTPRYMAPEVLAGAPATIQSDLFSLGLILYEVVTGRHPFDADVANTGERPVIVSPPSGWAADLDPGFERIILDCLEPDPGHRPKSTYDVLAALPGGEVLALMVAAGETPPVDLVAAARTNPRWSVAISVSCAFITVLGLMAALLLADKTLLIPFARLSQPPDVLAHRAGQMLKSFGYDPAHYHTEQEFVLHQARWESMRETSVDTIHTVGPCPTGGEIICFRFALHRSSTDNPSDLGFLESRAPETPVAEVLLDGQGRLREIICRTSPDLSAGDPRSEVLWPALFDLAGLKVTDFREVDTSTRSAVHREGSRIWELTGRNGQPIRVHAVERNGQLLRFDVMGPGTSEWMRSRETSGRLVIVSVLLLTLIGTIPLAWNNIRHHRSDRWGAFRLALFVFGLQCLLYGVRHPVSFDGIELLTWLISGFRVALFVAFIVWLYYVALEPHVRRYWPQSLISWSRVLTGRSRDPLVGRDVLVGCAIGVGVFVLMQLNAWLALGSHHPYSGLMAPIVDWDLGRLSGYRFAVSSLADAVLLGIGRGLLILALMLLVRLAVRHQGIAGAAFFVLLTVAYIIASHPVGMPAFINCGIITAGTTIVLQRAGFLAFAVSQFITRLLLIAPMTSDMHAWYADQCLLTVLIVAGCVVWALYVSFKPRRPSIPHQWAA